MEYDDYQMKPGPMDEAHIATIIKELLKGLEYLHKEGKIHRDIKGAGTLPLLDFPPYFMFDSRGPESSRWSSMLLS